MRRVLIVIGAVILVLLGVRYALLARTPDLTPPPAMASALPANPLPPCPDSPNCVRTTRRYDVTTEALFDRAETALREIGASSVEAQGEDQRLHAVFRVILFKDDVLVAVEPQETGSALHIRSASRVGYSDLGVNARRVKRFFEALEATLQ
jgi:uncharacterized protein (DUF1499 family)